MSSAFYPLGMKSYNNHVNQGGYKSWKGDGVLSNPVGITSGTIRPLTNNDPTNNYPTKFGLPRPIKHARKGRGFTSTVIIQNPENPTDYIEVDINRCNKSSSGGTLVKQMIDTPGGFSVSQNTSNEVTNIDKLNTDCKNCAGIGIVASYYPNNLYLTDNPEPTVENNVLCCNAERKARRRVTYASTNLKKNYYTALQQYRQNRCKTYDQRVFNFQSNNNAILLNSASDNPFVTETAILQAKPGSPLALYNTYFANCQPNGDISEATEIALVTKLLDILLNNSIITQTQYTYFIDLNNMTLQEIFNYINTLPTQNKTDAISIFVSFVNNPYYGVPFAGPRSSAGCKLVVYKPSNPQYATQGAVSSSTRLLKLNVNTISTNAATFDKRSVGTYLNINDITNGSNTENVFILKNKASKCNNPPIIKYQNKTACNITSQ